MQEEKEGRGAAEAMGGAAEAMGGAGEWLASAGEGFGTALICGDGADF